MSYNSDCLLEEANYLGAVIRNRVAHSVARATNEQPYAEDIPAPKYDGKPTIFTQYLQDHTLNFSERILLSLALAPHIKPSLIQQLFNSRTKVRPEFGGIQGKYFRGIIPTGLTWQFLVCGTDTKRRLLFLEQFPHNTVLKSKVVTIEEGYSSEPFMNGPLVVEPSFLEAVLTNQDISKILPVEA